MMKKLLTTLMAAAMAMGAWAQSMDTIIALDGYVSTPGNIVYSGGNNAQYIFGINLPTADYLGYELIGVKATNFPAQAIPYMDSVNIWHTPVGTTLSQGLKYSDLKPNMQFKPATVQSDGTIEAYFDQPLTITGRLSVGYSFKRKGSTMPVSPIPCDGSLLTLRGSRFSCWGQEFNEHYIYGALLVWGIVRKISAPDTTTHNIVKVGYYKPGEVITYSGGSQAVTYTFGANLTPDSMAKYKDYNLVGIRAWGFSQQNLPLMANVKIWHGWNNYQLKTLSPYTEYGENGTTRYLTDANLSENGEITGTFEPPFKLSGQGITIGYQFEATDVLPEGGVPIQVGNPNNNGRFSCWSNSAKPCFNNHGNNGSLVIQALLEAPDGTTGIDETNIAASQQPAAYYDLSGRRVTSATRGLVIKVQNGKATKLIR